MPLRPLEDVLGPLVLPIRGKEYTLPTVSMPDGVRIVTAKPDDPDPITIVEIARIVLGDAYEQMTADGVPNEYIDRALWTGLTDLKLGRASAEQVWENGVPKAVIDAMLKTLPQTPPGEAPTTPQPDSGSGTKTTAPAAPRSRGRKS